MIILMFLLIAIAVVFATYNLSIIRSMPPGAVSYTHLDVYKRQPFE